MRLKYLLGALCAAFTLSACGGHPVHRARHRRRVLSPGIRPLLRHGRPEGDHRSRHGRAHRMDENRLPVRGDQGRQHACRHVVGVPLLEQERLALLLRQGRRSAMTSRSSSPTRGSSRPPRSSAPSSSIRTPGYVPRIPRRRIACTTRSAIIATRPSCRCTCTCWRRVTSPRATAAPAPDRVLHAVGWRRGASAPAHGPELHGHREQRRAPAGHDAAAERDVHQQSHDLHVDRLREHPGELQRHQVDGRRRRPIRCTRRARRRRPRP